MKKLLPVIAVAVVAVVAIVLLAASSSQLPYEVRAIFDNAGFVIPGEDVKVAGVKVGKIASLDVTPNDKAAVVLEIDQSGYQDFRQDASCIVRPQSLIGERFVECTPTQPRPVGQNPPPPLHKLTSGPGKGQYYLPVTNTQQTVDIDEIGDIMRQPEQQRLSLILNELGTGLAGRGSDLNDVIKRADPALQATDNVLRILAAQNKTLEQLATNSDVVLGPLAREKEHVAGAIRNSSKVAEATAEKSAALEADIQTLPRFLDELNPTMQQLGQLADASTPVLNDLHANAPEINQVIERLGPFSHAAIPAVTSLGAASKTGIPAVTDARPVIADLRALANVVRPAGALLAPTLQSFNKTGGIERLLDYVFYQATSVNGYDAIGHYLRAEMIVNQCVAYATTPVSGCSSNFNSSASASSSKAVASVADAVGDDPVLKATAQALAKALGEAVDKAKKKTAKKHHASKKHAAKKHHAAKRHAKHPAKPGAPTPTPTPDSAVTQVGDQPTPTPAAGDGAAAATPTATPTPTPSPDGTGDALLNYLFGGNGGGGG
jgi:phospholipid/cholesterol/gamma-HCH transport system substrate-binding protein